MKFLKYHLIFLAILLGGQMSQLFSNEFEMIIDRYQKILLSANENESKDEKVKEILGLLKTDGSFSSIDYGDKSRGSWDPFGHLRYIERWSLSYHHPKSSYYQSKELLTQMENAIKCWQQKKLVCNNWWYNEIGVPMVARNILALMRKQLSEGSKNILIQLIGQNTFDKKKMTGANLAWLAEMSLHYGCYTSDEKRIQKACDALWKEIKIGDSEGIQNDFSFFQHGARLQTFHYGQGFLKSVIENAWQLHGSKWAIPSDKKKLITTYLLNGPQWMSRGKFTAPSTLDRSCSRLNALKCDISDLIKLWCDVDTDEKELLAYLKNVENNQTNRIGFRYFPVADFAVYQHKEASVFLKTISNRTFLSEDINSENLKGKEYLNCGDHYVLRNGSEYTNIQPFWHWRLLPGLTSVNEAKKMPINRNAFVGGISNGESGFCQMIYTRKGKDTELSTKKVWFFHQDYMVCLMSELNWQGTTKDAITCVEQSFYQGACLSEVDGKSTHAKVGEKLENVDWVLHHGLGYMPFGDNEVVLSKREGSWNQINAGKTKEKLQAELFQLNLRHQEKNKSSGYAVVLGASEEKMRGLHQQQPWKILKNETQAQIISFDSQSMMGVFYQSNWEEKDAPINVDGPCLLMWGGESILICDPTQSGGKRQVKHLGKTFEVNLPKDGSTVVVK